MSSKIYELGEASTAFLTSSNSLHSSRRKDHVVSSFTSAIEVSKGLEGRGVSIGAVHRSSDRPFTPLTNALEEALHDYLAKASVEMGERRVVEQRYADIAVSILKARLQNETHIGYWEERVSALEAKETGMTDGEERHRVSTELKLAREKYKAVSQSTTPTVAGDLRKAAAAMEFAIGLVQPHSPCLEDQIRCLEAARFCKYSDVVIAAISALSPPIAMISRFQSFMRKAKTVYDDMGVSLDAHATLRCDTNILTNALSEDDVDIVKQAITLLRGLAHDSQLAVNANAKSGKPSATVPLANTPILLKQECDPTTGLQAKVQPKPARMTLHTLPPIDVIEGSKAAAILVPTTLFAMPPRFVVMYIAEKTWLPTNPTGTILLAQLALSDTIWQLDNFMDTDAQRRSTSCPFSVDTEFEQPALGRLTEKFKRASVLLRGNAETETQLAGCSEAASIASPGVTTDEERSGVFDDNRDLNKDATIVRFAFQLTLSDGRVLPFEVTWNGSNYDRQHGWAREAECFDHFHDTHNSEKAMASARKEFDRFETAAKDQASKTVAKTHCDMWLNIAQTLRSIGSDITRFSGHDTKDKEACKAASIGRALCNAAAAVGNVNAQPGIDATGQNGTQIYGPSMTAFRRHSSSHTVETCKSDDKRRKGKGRANDFAASAPVQIDCKMLDLVNDPMRQVDHDCSLKVLKRIAEKAAGSDVAEMAYAVRKTETHGRTIRRENFLPIFEVDALFNVADVITKGITLFSKAHCAEEKRVWMGIKKRKCA